MLAKVIPDPAERDVARFFTKVVKQDGCWGWLASLDKHGYPRFSIKHVVFPAHRFSYKIHKSDPPRHLYVCHSCDNPACCNPDHLFLGNQLDNMRDAVQKGRHSFKTQFKRQFGVALIEEIKRAGGSQRDIARRFNVSQMTVVRAQRGYK